MDNNVFLEAKQLIDSATHILIIQADNPDADSLGSALALEQIFTELGKETTLYCGVDMPTYLHYMQGWSRVDSEVPTDVDAWIVVDAATTTLIEKLQKSPQYSSLSKLPSLVLDHHAHVQDEIEANIQIVDNNYSSTGELIYALCQAASWKISTDTGQYIITAILGDTQGLSNNLAKPNTYRVVADLIELGVDRATLEENRRQFSKLAEKIYRYKARLINRTELYDNNSIAWVAIPQEEITEFSSLYNPVALIQPDMLQIESVQLVIVFKTYNGGKITGSIRCNNSAPVAAKLALELGGGGHEYASGFKITDGRPFNEIKSECLRIASDLLAKI